MGLGPNHYAQTGVGRPDAVRRPMAREGPDVRCLSDVRRFSSGGLRSDVRASVVRGASEDRSFGSGVEVSVVRRGPDVRSLEVIGRLEPGNL